jgi:hypothetical protein
MVKKQNNTKTLLIIGGVLLLVFSMNNEQTKKEASIDLVHSFIDKYTTQSCSGGGCTTKVCSTVGTEPDTLAEWDLTELESLTGLSCLRRTEITHEAIDCTPENTTNFVKILTIVDIAQESVGMGCQALLDIEPEALSIGEYSGIKLYRDSSIIDDITVFCTRNDKFGVSVIEAEQSGIVDECLNPCPEDFQCATYSALSSAPPNFVSRITEGGTQCVLKETSFDSYFIDPLFYQTQCSLAAGQWILLDGVVVPGYTYPASNTGGCWALPGSGESNQRCTQLGGTVNSGDFNPTNCPSDCLLIETNEMYYTDLPFCFNN